MYPSLSCNSVLQTQPALNSEMAFVSLGLDYVTNTWLLRLSIQWPKLVFGWLPVLSFFSPLVFFKTGSGCSGTHSVYQDGLTLICLRLPPMWS